MFTKLCITINPTLPYYPNRLKMAGLNTKSGNAQGILKDNYEIHSLKYIDYDYHNGHFRDETHSEIKNQ